jgi:thiol-disulfide isomerase/thioredoxin
LRNAIVLVVVIVVVFFMLVAGRRIRHNGAAGPTLSGNVKGALAPDFTLKTIDGKDVKLSDLRGKAVLLNFWATWCGPCKIEIPWFMELEKQYAAQGLVVVGVAMDDNAKDVVPKFAQEMKIDYPVLIGTEQVADQYGGVEGLPTTFYIGRDGKIVKRIAGLTSHSDIEDSIKAALNTASGQVPSAMLMPEVAQ